MRALLLICALAIATPAFAQDAGAGDAPRATRHDVRDAVSAPLLGEIGPDVFRFSQAPALGGRGYVMTFVGQADGAWAEIIWLDGHPSLGWRVTRRQRFELAPSEYERLATFVDQQLARGAPDLRSEAGDVIMVCTDGPGYLTERLMDGDQSWLRGFCGDDHPNDAIKAYLSAWALHRLGGE